MHCVSTYRCPGSSPKPRSASFQYCARKRRCSWKRNRARHAADERDASTRRWRRRERRCERTHLVAPRVYAVRTFSAFPGGGARVGGHSPDTRLRNDGGDNRGRDRRCTRRIATLGRGLDQPAFRAARLGGERHRLTASPARTCQAALPYSPLHVSSPFTCPAILRTPWLQGHRVHRWPSQRRAMPGRSLRAFSGRVGGLTVPSTRPPARLLETDTPEASGSTLPPPMHVPASRRMRPPRSEPDIPAA